MRLVYLYNGPIPSDAAGAVQVMNMCSAFAGLGVDVHLVVPRTGDLDDQSLRETLDYYGCENAFTIERVPVKRGSRFAYPWIAAKIARSRKADLAFGRCIRSCLAAALRGLPVMHEAHGPVTAYSPTGQIALRLLVRSRRFERLVVISRALANYYSEQFPKLARPPLVAPSATLLAKHIVPLRQLGPGSRLRVGYIGSLHPGKGMELIAELAERSDHEYVVAGGTAEQVSQWKGRLGDRVTFLGHVPNHDVPALLGTLDVALAPYLRLVSGSATRFNLADWMSPMKIFEYMAHGRPIVTSDLPTIREIVRPGVDAILCDPDDPDQWLAVIEQLAADPQLRESLGAAAVESVRDSYQWSVRAERILAAHAAAASHSA